MIAFLFPALLISAAPEPCKLPESMPEPSEMMAGEGEADWCLASDFHFLMYGPHSPPAHRFVAEDPVAGTAQVIHWRWGPGDGVPADWRMMFEVPAIARPGEFEEVLIQRAGDNLIVVTANPAWRIGNAVCAGEGGVMTGYLLPGIAPTDVDRAAMKGLTDGSSALDPGNIMCTLLKAEGARGSYRPSFRGPQGRPLPEVDAYYADTRWRSAGPGDLVGHLRINR